MAARTFTELLHYEHLLLLEKKILLSLSNPNSPAELDNDYEDADLPAHAPASQHFHFKLQEFLLLEKKKLLSQMVSTRHWWTRPIWMNRIQESEFHTVMPLLISGDEEYFKKYYRMSAEKFEQLHALLEQHLTKLHAVRERIPSRARLAITISTSALQGTFSIVLMTVCDSDLKFVVVDVGAFGRQSDGGTLGVSRFGKCLEDGKLGLPAPETLPSTNTQALHVFVGDDAFQLRQDFLKPYSGRQISSEKRIFNYRLSRASCADNTFGVMVSKFRILRRAINLLPKNVDYIVMACCVLHNFLRDDAIYMSQCHDDIEQENRGCDGTALISLQSTCWPQLHLSAAATRDLYCDYFGVVAVRRTPRRPTGGGKDGSPATQETSADSKPEPEDSQLWPRAKVWCLIESKKKYEADKRVKLKTKKDEWKTLAASINAEFGSHLNANQVENKWRTLRRAYLKAKSHNSRSGNDLKVIDYEEELSEVFEKDHAVNPTYLVEPGVVKKSDHPQPKPVEQSAGGSDEPVDVAAEPQSGPPVTKKPRKKKNSNVTEALLARLDEVEKNRAERHKDLIASRGRHEALFERLVVAAENYFCRSSRQPSEAE
ncbi:hypothetical protein MTO96_048735 [Rhipicephalus appendiculatus]